MADLRWIFESVGLTKAETHIASGNVVFDASKKDERSLEKTLEAALFKALGYRAATFVRSVKDIGEIVRHPLIASEVEPGVTRYVGFTRNEPSPSDRRKLLSLTNEINDFEVSKREVIWTCRARFSEAGLSGAVLEKTLGTEATFRNATTVRAIARKYFSLA